MHPSQRFQAPQGIQAGSALKDLLNQGLVGLIADSLAQVVPGFSRRSFVQQASAGLEGQELKARAKQIADALAAALGPDTAQASAYLIASLGPKLQGTTAMGLKPFFYLPHSSYIHDYLACDWESAMAACYALTSRFTAEFAIRPLLHQEPKRSIAQLQAWLADPDAHVRRLISEGSRPRLPWAERLPKFQRDPKPVLPLLRALSDDPQRYVIRSVANHVGDIAKDHPAIAFRFCEEVLQRPTKERRYLVRHALRHPAKQGVPQALALRAAAGNG